MQVNVNSFNNFETIIDPPNNLATLLPSHLFRVTHASTIFVAMLETLSPCITSVKTSRIGWQIAIRVGQQQPVLLNDRLRPRRFRLGCSNESRCIKMWQMKRIRRLIKTSNNSKRGISLHFIDLFVVFSSVSFSLYNVFVAVSRLHPELDILDDILPAIYGLPALDKPMLVDHHSISEI